MSLLLVNSLLLASLIFRPSSEGGFSAHALSTLQQQKKHGRSMFFKNPQRMPLRGGGVPFIHQTISTSLTATDKSHSTENSSPAKRDSMALKVASPGMSGGDLSDMDDDNIAASQGRMLLLIVALLYGTLNVALRLVYNYPMPDGSPMSASCLSAVRGWMATLCFVPLWFVSKSNSATEKADSNSSIETDTSDAPPMWMAALELAIWNCGAQGLLNIGLLTTGSARAAFLTQLSVVMTPIISVVAGQVVPSTVWIACILALCGLVLLSGGGPAIVASLFGTATTATSASGSAAAAFGAGDLFILGGALSWSFYLFRLTKIGKRYNDIQLQAGKTILLAVLYSIWFVVGMGGFSAVASSLSGGAIGSVLSTVNPMIWVVLLYSALGPGTVADVVQQQGQSKISSASEANVILSLEPVFAALCAYLLIGETTTLYETAGGALILVAALVATR